MKSKVIIGLTFAMIVLGSIIANAIAPTELSPKPTTAEPTAQDGPKCTTTEFGNYGKVTVYHRGQPDEFVVPGGPSAPVCN